MREIPQNEGKSPKTRDKTSLKLGGLLSLKTGGTQKTLLQKKKEKIIRPRILANPLTSQKTIFLWLNRMLQFRAAASGEQQKT